MRKVVFVSILVVMALLVSCSAGSPKSAVQKFFDAVEKNDEKAMAEVATPETVQIMTLFGAKTQGMVAETGGIKSITETIDGDTAVAVVTFNNGEESNIDLIKVDGKWKVSMSMEK
ncbi:MAG: DUF4878 domain-containing protein [Treponema sp.]|jgi:hypothetical protein|nr:DUF4878 domain-containing protein [Treponema sp.]